MLIWTAPSTRTCFKNSIPKNGDSSHFELFAAKGEIVSTQCLLRNVIKDTVTLKDDEDAQKHTVTITDADVIQINGEEYDTSLIRIQAQEYISFADSIAYPDPISNECTATIPLNTTQGFWVTFPILEAHKAGDYNFRIVFRADEANEYIADVTLKVYDVLIPPADKCEYSIEHFHTPDEQIMLDHAGYKFKAYDEKWWLFMEAFAKSLRECRSNIYRIYPLELMKAAGSRRIACDKWHFDFSLFDKLVELLQNTGTVKKFAINDQLASWEGREIYSLNENGDIIGIDISNPDAEIWAKEYYTALYEHITEHSNVENWIVHIQDEPKVASTWIWARKLILEYMPKVRCGNPFSLNIASELGDYVDLYIPVFHVVEDNLEFYNKILENSDKDVWAYCCCEPNLIDHPGYLTRFIDSPTIHSRIIAWATYSRRFSGFLHYGYSFWQKTEQFYKFGIEKYSKYKGDCMLIYPSPDDNSYRISVRYINIRDGAQDFELLKIAEKADKEKTMTLSKSIAVGYKEFNEDEKHFFEVRKRLLELAEEACKNC